MREREETLNILEKYCGARLTTHAFRIGGLQYELYDGFEEDIRRFCDSFPARLDEYDNCSPTTACGSAGSPAWAC